MQEQVLLRNCREWKKLRSGCAAVMGALERENGALSGVREAKHRKGRSASEQPGRPCVGARGVKLGGRGTARPHSKGRRISRKGASGVDLSQAGI